MSFDFQDPELSKKILPKTAKTVFGNLEYVDIGTGPVIVCLHGAMGGYDQSVILAQTIGNDRFRYLCISRPGYLGTPLSSGRSSEKQADLIAALLDLLDIKQAGVFAVSGGGPSAIQFGLRHPGRCKGLVLLSTCTTRRDAKIPISAKMMMLLARWPWFVRRLRKKAELNLEAGAKRSIRDPEILARTIGDKETWPLFSALLLSAFDRMGGRITGTRNDIKITRTADYLLENLSLPVLIVHGTRDRIVPFEAHAKLFETRAPNAELLAVEGGEHVAIFTHRKMIRAKVSEFTRKYFSI